MLLLQNLKFTYSHFNLDPSHFKPPHVASGCHLGQCRTEIQLALKKLLHLRRVENMTGT